MNYEVYCDESNQDLFWASKTNPFNKYVLIGGLWIPANDRNLCKIKIKSLREKHNLLTEYKWKKISSSKLEFYIDLVNMFFASKDMRFRVIVLLNEELDSAKFHKSDNELMFYKFYYQLLHPWIQSFSKYSIFVDLKTNRFHNRLNTLKNVLNNTKLLSEIINVQALKSSEVELIQLVDILIGACSYAFHQKKDSVSKLEVIKTIEKHIGRIRPTSFKENKFNVFRFRPIGR